MVLPPKTGIMSTKGSNGPNGFVVVSILYFSTETFKICAHFTLQKALNNEKKGQCWKNLNMIGSARHATETQNPLAFYISGITRV